MDPTVSCTYCLYLLQNVSFEVLVLSSFLKWTMLAVKAVQLGNRERLLAFCGAVQKRCPVGAYIRPVAGATSGYGDEVPFLSVCQIEVPFCSC